MFKKIHHFSIHAASVSRLIDKIKILQDQIHKEKQIISFQQIDTNHLRNLRNELEHFEDRLDVWHYLNSGGPILDMNVVNDNTKSLKHEQCLRILNIHSDIITILGNQYDLQAIFNTLKQIEKAVKSINIKGMIIQIAEK